MKIKANYKVSDGTSTREVTSDEIQEYATFFGIDTYIPGRYTSLFILNLMLLEWVHGISPHSVVDEIKSLEGLLPPQQTKPAAEFKGSVLKGLWHKHFFPALPSVMAHNITNQLGKDGLENLVNEIFDPSKNSVVTKEMINELAHRVTVEQFENRSAAGKLTGEWIIFAKENGANYYICISPHASGDENIINHIKSVGVHEFPFLSRYFS